MHVHVLSENGEAKLWIEPKVELAMQHGLKDHEVSEIIRVTEEKADEIRESWNSHFPD